MKDWSFRVRVLLSSCKCGAVYYRLVLFKYINKGVHMICREERRIEKKRKEMKEKVCGPPAGCCHPGVLRT